MREIITLQLGPLSNYTGAHFWNLQDEALGAAGGERSDGDVAEDVLFSWSEDGQGAPVYRPRAVIVDASGATGGVSFSLDAPAVPGATAAASAWSGGAQVVASGRIPKSAFTQQLELQAGVEFDREPEAVFARHQAALEEAARQLDAPAPGARGGCVRFWTDFLKAQLHSRTFQALPGAWHGAGGLDGYGAASSLAYGVRPAVEGVAEAVRWWSEGCDSLQGIQVFADDLTGFGGLARSALDEVREELPGAHVLYFSLRPTDSGGGGEEAASGSGNGGSRGGSRGSDALSEALAVAELSERCAAYVPLRVPRDAPSALPLLRFPLGWRGSDYLRGGLLGAAIDTITLPLRLAGSTSALEGTRGAADLQSWTSLLSGRGGANLAAAALQLPTGVAEPADWITQHASDARIDEGSSQARAGGAEAAAPYRLSTLRNAAVLVPGPPVLGVQPGSSLAESLVLRGARRASRVPATAHDAAEALDAALRSEPPRRCVVHRCVLAAAVAVPLPFPGLFGPTLGREGDVARWSSATAEAGPTGAAGGGAGTTAARDGRHVVSCPVLTRVAATSEFAPWLEERARGLSRSSATAGGRALAEAWGYGSGDLEEVGERLRRLAGSYADGSDDGLDD